MGRGRAPCCEKVGLNKGSWTPEEDMRLMAYIRRFGHGNWRALPRQAGLLRCGKSCRLRWINYLRPDIKRGNFTKEEEDTIISLHGVLGNKWSKIASCLPGRTDNEIKNVWNIHLKKRLLPKDGPLRSNPEDQPQPQPSSPSTSTSAASSSNQAGPVQPADKIEIPVEPSFETVWEMLEESLNPEPSPIETAQLWDVIDDGGSRELGLAAAAADGGESSGGGGSESERWLADLEKELESWPGEVEGEDPVTSYFQTGSPSRWISY